MKARGFISCAVIGIGLGLLVRAVIGRASPPPHPRSEVGVGVGVGVEAGPAHRLHAPDRVRRAVRQRDLGTANPAYDPIRFSEEEELTPHEVFEQESWDPSFAPAHERRLHESVLQVAAQLGLSDAIGAVTVECRTLSCEVVVTAARGDRDRVYDVLNGLPFAPVVETRTGAAGAEEGGALTLSLLFSPGHRDPAAFASWQRESLWPRIARVLSRRDAR